MNEFNMGNMVGYTQSELDGFNNEWEQIVIDKNLDADEYEYDIQIKKLSDDIVGR